MLITLHKPGHSSFFLIWDTSESLADTLKRHRDHLCWAWGNEPQSGGCVCGWQRTTTARWPAWFWWSWAWRHHVAVCKVPRDRYGNVVEHRG